MAHKKLCKTCQKKNHDTCALVNGCPCCEDTMSKMRDENHEADDITDDEE